MGHYAGGDSLTYDANRQTDSTNHRSRKPRCSERQRSACHRDDPHNGAVGHSACLTCADQQSLIESSIANGRRPWDQADQCPVHASGHGLGQVEQAVSHPSIDLRNTHNEHADGDQGVDTPHEGRQTFDGITVLRQCHAHAKEHDDGRLDEHGKRHGHTVSRKVIGRIGKSGYQ